MPPDPQISYDSFLESLREYDTPAQSLSYDSFLAELQANRPLSEEEFVERQKRLDARGKWEATGAFMGSAIGAVGEFFSGAKDFIMEEATPFTKALARGSPEAKRAIKLSGKLGMRNTKNFLKDVKGSLMDEFGDYDQPTEWKREYQRYLRNYDSMQYRDLLMESSPYKKTIAMGEFIADPINLVPMGMVFSPVGKVIKGGVRKGIKLGAAGTGKLVATPSAWVGKKMEYVAGTPKRWTESALTKMGMEGAIPALQKALSVGAVVGVFQPLALPFTVAAGAEYLGKKLAKGADATRDVLKVFSTPSGQTRFLSRLAADKTVPPNLRSMAAWANKYKGTQVGDYMFNVLADGVSAGTIMSAFNAAAGHTSAEEMGQSFGLGFAMGGTLFAPFGTKGAGKTTLGVDKRGKMTPRSKITVSNYLENKLSNEQRKLQEGLPNSLQVALATNDAVGTSGVSVNVMAPKELMDLANESIKARNEKALEEGKPPEDLLEHAPKGWVDRQTRTIFLNKERIGGASREGFEMFLHEMGHVEMMDWLSRDPAALEMMLDEFHDPDGEVFHIYGNDGTILREVTLNKEATEVWRDYNRTQKGIEIGRDAEALMQEIFADQYSMAFHKDPNVYEALHPTMKSALYNSMRRLLSSLGIVDPRTGNLLTNTISTQLKKHPVIIRHIRNYKKARETYISLKDKLIEEGLPVTPHKGQTAGESFTEKFGGVPITDRQSRQFVLSDKVTRNELKDSIEDGAIEQAEAIQAKEEAEVAAAEATQAKDQAEASSADESVKQAARDAERIAREKLTAAQDAVKKTDYVGLGQGEEGRTLSRRMKDLFTKGQPDSPVAKIIDFLQEAIDGRFSISFGYRSGKRLKRYNKFYLRDITLWGWQISPKSGTFRSLKVMGWNNAVIRENVKTLIDEGFITKKSAEQFMREFEVASEKAMRDPEGRINPLGFKENEIMAAILGMESISKGEAHTVFKNKRLADFFTEQNELRDTQRSLKKAIVSYDAEALAGAAPTGRKGTGFDYYNVKNNYMPAMPEGKPREQTVPLPFIEDLGGEDAAAGFRRVATDTMRKAEFERFQKGITEKEKFEAIGNQSQLQPFMPRFPKRGEKQYMPAERTLGLKDNITDDVLPSITQAKLSPQQLQAALAKTAGAKSYADEIGLTDFVKDRKSITKDEVEAYVRENSPKLEVEVRELDQTKFSEYQEPGGENYREVIVRLPKPLTTEQIVPDAQAVAKYGKEWDGLGLEHDTLYSKMNLSPEELRGRDALEVKMDKLHAKMVKETAFRLPKQQRQPPFSDELHFGDNVLLWLRLSDRIDANGKKVLFIEELQSNWHQRGRKEGYGHREWNKGDLVAKRTKVGTWSITIRGARVIAVEAKTKSEAIDVAWKRLQEGESELHPMDEVTFDEGKGVPDAPFKKNWPALGLKYAVKEAIEGGYDRVAWLDGEGQAARYDLSKQVKEIAVPSVNPNSRSVRIDPIDGNSFKLMVDNGGKVKGLYAAEQFTGKQLDAVIGKELAKKVMAFESPGKLSGLDLKVGGEGMKAFYDREMRSLASKISKKIKGGKVEREVRSDLGGKMTRRQQEAGTTGEFGSHGFDVPKDPAAVDSLRLYMPADRAPTDARPPSLMMERGEGKQYMPAAYHGTPHTFKPEEGAPMGRFRSAQIGTGQGGQHFGYGLNFAGKKGVADYFRKINKTKGSLYKVELAPKENEYLYWDKFLKDQPKGVREKLATIGETEAEKSGSRIYEDLSIRRRVEEWERVGEISQGGELASATLLEAGIPGIKHLDDASVAKGKGDYNYVIFDEGAVTITEKLFMPADRPALLGNLGKDIRAEVKKQGWELNDPQAVAYAKGRIHAAAQEKQHPESVPLKVSTDKESVPKFDETGKETKTKFDTEDYMLSDAPEIQHIKAKLAPRYEKKVTALKGERTKLRAKIRNARKQGQPFKAKERRIESIEKQLNRMEDAWIDKSVAIFAKRLLNEHTKAMKVPEVAAGKGWYGRMRTGLQRVFGASMEMFAQLLGATSPQTPVKENFIQALAGIRRFSSGKYDTVLQGYADHILKARKRLENGTLKKEWQKSGLKGKYDPVKALRRDIAKWREVDVSRQGAKWRVEWHDNFVSRSRLFANKQQAKDFAATIEVTRLPLRAGNKKFNANTGMVMDVMLGRWLDEAGGPKAPNFAGNLTGRTLKATIDVWAARTLRRISYQNKAFDPATGKLSQKRNKWRILPEAEKGVNSERKLGSQPGGDFELGQRIFQKAADEIGINADDLQAIMWFWEKEVWTNEGWTRGSGKEKSSFDTEFAHIADADRYQAGITTFTTSKQFNKATFDSERQGLQQRTGKRRNVIVSRVNESEGYYAGELEPTFDMEWTMKKVGKGDKRAEADPTPIIRDLLKVADRNNQYDLLVTKLTDRSDPNARPGVEIGFKEPLTAGEAKAIMDTFVQNGIDGFTIATDQANQIIGFRAAFAPEISARWADSKYWTNVKNMRKEASAFTKNIKNAILSMPKEKIAYSERTIFDVRVYGKEEYKVAGQQKFGRTTNLGRELGRRRRILRTTIKGK